MLLMMASFIGSDAYAQSFGVLGGMQRYTIVLNDVTMPAEPGFDTLFGIALFSSSYPVELDILYTSKKLNEYYSESSLQFPVFYRANISKELLFGFGAFADYSMEDQQNTYGRQKLDLGLTVSMQYRIPFGKSFLVLDARYLHGMTDLPGNSRNIALLAGLFFK